MRLRAWAELVAVAGLGGAVGAVALAWLPSWGAAIVSAVGAGVAGVYMVWAQDLIGRRRTITSATPWKRVRDIDDPISLGVHPAEARQSAAGRLDRVPDFVVRDCLDEVCARLRLGGFVLLIGESAAGKSRLAFEAMRLALPDHRFHQPLPGQPLDGLVDVVASGRRHVVWLDELDLYLTASGLSVSTVGRLLAERDHRHVVVLATMRIREYDRYSARNRDASDAATWRAGRAVLLLAEDPIELIRSWSAAEVGRAVAGTDPRVARAVSKADRFGIAEVLAAGPELVGDWRRAAKVGANPRGAALVSAAVDCRRMGLHRPVSRDLLVKLHGPYLWPDGRPPESIDAALAWASTVAYGSSSLLTPSPGDHYLAFDYLIDQPFLPAVPDASWTTLLAAVTPAEAYDVGWAAIDLQRPDHGLVALGRARSHQIDNAEYAYVIALGNSGRPQAAADQLREITAERSRQFGPADARTLQARHDLARYLGEGGRPVEAAAELREVITLRTRVLGERDPATMTSREYLGRCIGEAGDPGAALVILTELAAAQRLVQGEEHIDTLLTRLNIARYTVRLGRPDTAIPALAHLIARFSELFGPDVPYSLSARYEHAKAIGLAGQPTQARTLLAELLEHQQRVLGRHQPRVFSTRHFIARFAGEAGEVAMAVSLFRELVTDRVEALGARHPRTLASRLELARFLSVAGDRVHADDLMRAVEADCRAVLSVGHPLTERTTRLRGRRSPDGGPPPGTGSHSDRVPVEE